MRSSRILLVLLLTTPLAVTAQQFGAVTAASDHEIFVGDHAQPAIPGSVYVFSLAGDSWAESQRLDAGVDARVGDRFGASLAADGDRMVVGAPGIPAVFVFGRSGSGWTLESKLDSDRVGFGQNVAVQGSNLLVLTPESDASPAHVEVFSLGQSQEWTPVTELKAPGDLTGDGFGHALAIHGDRAAVGAPQTNDAAGTVYTFHETGGAWSSGTEVTFPVSVGAEAFGSSLSMNDTHLVVGAPGFAGRAGIAVVFRPNEQQWNLESQLAPFSSTSGERFGSAIALVNGDLWIGAPGHGGRGGSGAIYQFHGNDTTGLVGASSTRIASPVNQRNARFGETLAALGNLAVVGAPGVDNRAGVAYAASVEGGEVIFSSALQNEIFGYESVAGETVECSEDEAGDFPCRDVDMLSFVSMEDLGADRGIRTNDLWGWEDPLTGREYAIVGLSNATSFVDVSDPANPVPLGILRMTETANMAVWRDMKVYRDHAYIVSDGAGEHGMQIFDLRRLRDVEGGLVEFEADGLYQNIFSAHNIVINEETGFGYSVGSSAGGDTCGGGLHMIDLREPAQPAFAGCFSDGETGRRGTGYSHDAQCVVYNGPDSDYRGREICVGANETAISIADVTDKENPVSVSIATYPSVAYAHQGWFTEDHRYFYLNDEIDEARDLVAGTRTLIWDLADLDDPVLAGEHVAETTETDHNLYVKGDLMYQSNTSAGLRILDISDPEKPFEVAYFDTSPVGGRGVSWSNYPYFKNGTIAVTGGHYGLFLLKKREVDL